MKAVLSTSSQAEGVLASTIVNDKATPPSGTEGTTGEGAASNEKKKKKKKKKKGESNGGGDSISQSGGINKTIVPKIDFSPSYYVFDPLPPSWWDPELINPVFFGYSLEVRYALVLPIF